MFNNMLEKLNLKKMTDEELIELIEITGGTAEVYHQGCDIMDFRNPADYDYYPEESDETQNDLPF
jgi:hypothetical protein